MRSLKGLSQEMDNLTRWRAETAIVVIVKVEIVEGTLQPLSELCVDPPCLLSVLLLLLPLLLAHLLVIVFIFMIVITKTIFHELTASS